MTGSWHKVTANTEGSRSSIRKPWPPAPAQSSEMEIVVHRGTQIVWIAEAEARQFQEAILRQRSPSEPHITITIAELAPVWLDRCRELLRLARTLLGKLSSTVDPEPALDQSNLAKNVTSARKPFVIIENASDAERSVM